MSSGAVPDPCAEAVENLYALLDEELTNSLRERVQKHFEECAHCFPLYRFELSFSRFLKARGAARAAPVTLRRRIFESLLLEPDGSDTATR